MVDKGLAMTIKATKVFDTLQVKINIANLLPHKFPTCALFRNFILLSLHKI